jgi:predicted secreted protein
MNWFTGIVTYACILAVVIFAVLPWGVRIPDEPEPGHATSAPANPRLGLKVIVALALSALIWLVVYAIVVSDWISFREMAGS